MDFSSLTDAQLDSAWYAVAASSPPDQLAPYTAEIQRRLATFSGSITSFFAHPFPNYSAWVKTNVLPSSDLSQPAVYANATTVTGSTSHIVMVGLFIAVALGFALTIKT